MDAYYRRHTVQPDESLHCTASRHPELPSVPDEANGEPHCCDIGMTAAVTSPDNRPDDDFDRLIAANHDIRERLKDMMLRSRAVRSESERLVAICQLHLSGARGRQVKSK